MASEKSDILLQTIASVWIRENIRQIVETKQLLIVGEDISETHLLAEKLDYQAHYDTLTSLYNRNHFEQELIIALQEVKGSLRSHIMFYFGSGPIQTD